MLKTLFKILTTAFVVIITIAVFLGIFIYLNGSSLYRQFFTKGYENIQNSDVRLVAVVNGQTKTNGGANLSDKFRIGSITKVFTATILLQLIQTGKLNLDSHASDFVTSVALPSDITVKELLQQTSGIKDGSDEKAFYPAIASPSATMKRSDFIKFASFKNKKDWVYSNTNYLLIGEIIEKVTGKSIAQNLHERIIDPLRLSNTCVPLADKNCSAEIGYTDVKANFNIDQGVIKMSDMTAFYGIADSAGYLISNVADLQTFFRALITGKIIDFNQMKNAVNAGTNGYFYQMKYGLGTMSFNDGSYGHAGQSFDTNTLVKFYPDRNSADIVLIGHSNISADKVMWQLRSAKK